MIVFWTEEEYEQELQQVRNETAREIYQELQGHGTTYVKKWIKEHYDVEIRSKQDDYLTTSN